MCDESKVFYGFGSLLNSVYANDLNTSHEPPTMLAMCRHQHHGFTFKVPEDWVNKSVIIYAAAPDQNRKITPNIVVTHDQTDDPSIDVVTYADHQLVQFAKRFDGFFLRKREEIKAAGQHFVDLRFTWTSNGTNLVVHQRFAQARDGAFISFTITLGENDAKDLDSMVSAILDSIRPIPLN